MSVLTRAARAAGLVFGLLLLSGVCTAKTPPPITTSLDVVTSPSAGGSGTVLWSGIASLTPQSAEVTFQLTVPGATAPVETRQSITMTAGKTAAASFRFETPAAGLYTINATVQLIAKDGRWADSKILRLDVPAAGGAKTLKIQPQTAAEYDAATPKRQPKALLAPSYLSLGSFSVSGTIRYTDKIFSGGATFGTGTMPVRRAKVEIRDREGTSSVILATATTNEYGFFTYTLPSNNDGDATGYDVFVRVIADGTESRVTDMNFKSYYYESATWTNWAGGALSMGTITLSETASAPWNIYDQAINGFDCIKALGSTPPKVNIAWARNNDTMPLTHYNYTERRIYLQGKASDPDEFDDAVILHEYGHHLLGSLSYDKNSGMDHGWSSPSDQPTAWSEGFASFFSSAGRNSRYYWDSVNGGITIIDLEAPTENPKGQNVEGAIAASLWDIFDSANDKDDYLYDRMGRIWAICTQYFNSSRSCVIRDFYDAWIAYNYPNPGLVEAILNEHGINYGWGVTPLLRSLSINNGAASTSSRDVLLNNVCYGTAKYYLASEASNFANASWRTWSTAAPFTLSAGNGTKTVYLKVKDAYNRVSNVQVDTITLNEGLVAPKLTSFAINNGAGTAYSRTVTLNHTWTGGTPYRYMVAENPKFEGVYWNVYSATPTYTLSAGNGTKTLYFKIKTSTNLGSNVMTDTIVLQETAKPSVTYLKINNGAASTASRTVTLNSACLNSPTQYLASESTTYAGATWKTWSGASAFSITSAGNGTKTIYFKVRNAAGESMGASAKIVLNEYTNLTAGATALTGNIQSGTDYDLYHFTVTTAGWYTIATEEGPATGGLHDGYMYLYNSAGTKVAEADNQGAYKMPMLSRYLAVGTYEAEVDGYSTTDTGTYKITLRTGSAYTPLTLDGSWVGGELLLLNDVDWFEFTVPTRGNYTIETLEDKVTDAVMYLYRGDEVEPLALNDDPVAYYASDGYHYYTMPTISTVLEPGTYRVAVLGWGTADVGAYTIRLRSGNRDVSCMTLVVGGWPVTGSVTVEDPDNYYMFTVDTKAKYNLYANAGSLAFGQMALYKITLDENNNYQEMLLGWDGNSGTNSTYMPQLAGTLDVGTYMVWFSSQYQDEGTYTLAVQYEGAAKPQTGRTPRKAQ